MKDFNRAMKKGLRSAMVFSALLSKSQSMNTYDAVISKRGLRLKRGMVRPGDEPLESKAEVEIIDVPVCRQAGMKIVSFITEAAVIRQILEHLNLWQGEPFP